MPIMPFVKLPNIDIALNTLWLQQILRIDQRIITKVITPTSERDQEYDYGDADLSKGAFELLVQELARKRLKTTCVPAADGADPRPTSSNQHTNISVRRSGHDLHSELV